MKTILRKATEIELVNLAKDSDSSVSNRAFEEIYRRYNKHLRFFIHRKMGGSEINNDDREDVLQIVFEKAFSKINTYEPKFKLSTWFMRIAKNLITDKYRKKGLNIQNFNQTDDDGNETTMEFSDSTYIPEDQMIDKQRAEFIHNLIDTKLKDEYKVLVMKFFIEGKPYQQIADELNIPIGTVKARLHRAKEILRESVDKKVLINA